MRFKPTHVSHLPKLILLFVIILVAVVVIFGDERTISKYNSILVTTIHQYIIKGKLIDLLL